jgi:glycosyltransferase involved in cell wall biosynthesis
MFLSIGFIQPHKGFDRAIRAFRGLPNARAIAP